MATTETGIGMIVNAEVVIGNVEHDQLPEIVDAVQADFDVKVKRVLGDTAFTCGENLVAAEARDVELIGPLAEPKCKDNPAHRDDPTQPVADELVDKLPVSAHTKRFAKTAFVFDEENDCYYCPAGKPLPHRITYSIGQPTERNVYTCGDCAGCALAPQCVRKSDAAGREVIDIAYEPARRRHRQRMESEAAQLAYKRRTHFGEVPFAVIKVMFDLRRFLLRGKEGVGQEWRWASTAFNLKKLMSKWEAVRALLEQKNEPAVV
jgi:hypothetical protein